MPALFIGAVVGTGIFTIIGSAIAGSADGAGAGPAVVISMILEAVASVFSALSYSEIAAMIPVAGSAYTYTYATMGEFMAWAIMGLKKVMSPALKQKLTL